MTSQIDRNDLDRLMRQWMDDDAISWRSRPT